MFVVLYVRGAMLFFPVIFDAQLVNFQHVQAALVKNGADDSCLASVAD